MKIIDTYHRPPHPPVTLSEAVKRTIERAPHAHDRQGAIEQLECKLDKASEIIAHLAEILVKKGMLTVAEVDELVGYSFTVTEET